MRFCFLALLLMSAGGCASQGQRETGAGGDTGSSWSGGGGGTPGGGGAGASDPGDCIAADGATGSSDSWNDASFVASVVIDNPASCARSYTLSTTQPLVDDVPDNPRTFGEQGTWPVVRSGHDMFDALYALALQEVTECAVDSISDGAFNGGSPIPCPPGGCFETGRKWSYVWTRDTAYAVLLGLGLIDPTRARNSLEYKLSVRRDGSDLQIVQDTGTGGSYPISTDRVVWAMGAWELLKFLSGDERTAFRDLAYEALSNTADHDRATVFDPSDGLYRGEQSFLDWREQSYPAWTATDPVQIGMSKALSTNVGHLRSLEVTAALATEMGHTDEAARYTGWAQQLRAAIDARFWLQSDDMPSSLITTSLDQAPTRRHDLLGAALHVMADIGSDSQQASTLAGYPHLTRGAPVLWPQQQLTPIYHNRGIWPFVTALWLEAAKKTGHAAVVTHGVHSLMRGAALNLSNMENFEMVSGQPWVDDGDDSGPVVNSQRQLWSVAGYLAMVQKVIFGLDANQQGIRFAPFVPQALRNGLFAGSQHIALSRIPYKGGHIAVVLDLGTADTTTSGALVAGSVRLNGADFGTGFAVATALTGDDLFEIQLVADATASDAITLVGDAALSDYRNLYGPRTPAISNLAIDNGLLGLSLDAATEAAADVTFDVYRDGQLVAQDLPGSTSYWVDPTSTPATNSHCYSVETQFVSSGNRSQHAKPVCWWGASHERITNIDATAMTATGGTLVFDHGYWHHEAWGDEAHTLTIPSFVPSDSGSYLLQLNAGNGAGPYDTGITCAIKLIEVSDGNAVVASGYVAMPQLGSWDQWRESSFLPVQLSAGVSYSITIREDARAINMSQREHFAIYDGMGGSAGRFNRVNIAEVKLLAVELP